MTTPARRSPATGEPHAAVRAAREPARTAAALRGTTTVSEKAVRKIAQRAAGEVLPASAAGDVRGSATVRGRRAAVALRVTLPYPAPLSETARDVQAYVAERTGQLTGLDVARPRLTTTRLAASAARDVEPVAADGPGARAPRRWWSARRGPTAVVLLLAAAACGAVTADVVRVHATGAPAALWRTRAVDWLAGHGPGQLPLRVAGLVAVVLGAWLLVLALTPGRRGLLVLAAPGGPVTAVVDRQAVASLVRDAVGDVDGVAAVRVRVGRRRVRVRAVLAFGEVGAARAQALEATGLALRGCLLRRPLRPKVSVVPDAAWQAPEETASTGGASAYDPSASTDGTPAYGTPPHGTPPVPLRKDGP
ncbi:DUF6286 domain-containing Asp23/Gls24 family envelope stress response protein [Streptomyces sp. NPDC001941]|uniref:DUF6286 domain-containing Asp23/Gls24 family envelope stress response protein n=1 Tax=Streptomyces sp. NPDC001941 TaxID=3154659 RepID=UPI0033255757